MSANQPPNFTAKLGGPRHTDPENLVLYAMQLLTADEAAETAFHLERCVECRSELARILGDLAGYAVSVDMEAPPPAARQRLMAQVAREKKIVPVVHVQEEPAPAPPIAAFGRGASVFSIEDRPPRRSPVAAILAGIGWAVAAALAVAATFLYKDRLVLRDTIASQSGLVQRLTADADNAHQLMDAITDPKAVRVTLTPKPLPKASPVGGVTYNPEKGSLVFLASNLDPLQLYKTYELWIIPADGSAPVPAGTFHPDNQGNASVVMPDLPKTVAAKAFGVTVEPDGGSQTPTLPIIMAGS